MGASSLAKPSKYISPESTWANPSRYPTHEASAAQPPNSPEVPKQHSTTRLDEPDLTERSDKHYLTERSDLSGGSIHVVEASTNARAFATAGRPHRDIRDSCSSANRCPAMDLPQDTAVL